MAVFPIKISHGWGTLETTNHIILNAKLKLNCAEEHAHEVHAL